MEVLPQAIVRVQLAGGLLWIAYGALVHAIPVVAANLLVAIAAGWKAWRSGRLERSAGPDPAPPPGPAAA